MSALLLAAVLAILPENRNADPVVSVQMEGDVARATPGMGRARALATQMFATAGVRLEWCDRPEKCQDWHNRLVVTLVPAAPSRLASTARAEALAFQGRNISIYLDRMPATSGPGSAASAILWAHVLVHEITHLLQASDYHAATGVMKAHWNSRDLAAMQIAPLSFTRFDVQMIHAGLAARRLASGQSVAMTRLPEAARPE
jgi:hypothetical protein